MREILFRGKNRDGEWVYGVYYKQDHYYNEKVEKHCIITSTDTLGNDMDLDFCDVIPETVGQFTGLTDKNGKKIFEGDIIKESYIGVAVIAYESASFVYKKTEYLNANWCCGTCIDDNENGVIDDMVEVIGNIHDQDIGE